MRGRKPTPTEVHNRNGNPGKRPTTPTTIAGRGKPDKPAHLAEPATRLHERASEAWDELVDVMHEGGILDRADALLVELAATNLAIFRDTLASLGEEGLTAEGQKSATVAHPSLSTLNSAGKELRQMLDNLGVGPVGRARLGIAAKTERAPADDLAAIGGGRRLGLVEGGAS
jgi:P27 family predicted phage terminase small subunit